MKKYIHIILGALLLSLVACNGYFEDIDNGLEGNNKVILSAKALGATTRANNNVIADTDIESTLAWIDVYVLDEDFNVWHSERIDKSSNPVVGGGDFVLSKNRDEFDEGDGFYIYMIANSTSPLSEATTWDELKELTQKDEHLHLTGSEGVNDITVPSYFLMDGFAYEAQSASDKGPDSMEPIIINSGADEDIVLAGTLQRAAAKIMISITQGDSVEFKQNLELSSPLYSFYQLPISTLVVTPDAGVNFVSDKQTTKEWGINPQNFFWNTDKSGKPVITLTGYAYANDWSGKQSTNESSLLLNIPMMWNKDGDSNTGEEGKEQASPVNWYKVPLSKNSKFERNTCYIINIKINAIGAEEKNTPVELEDIEYVTLPWQDVSVTIGGNEARYLTLNTDLVKIYDSNFDLDQLTFTSSSPIKSIKLKDVFSHNDETNVISSLPLTKESDGTTEAEYETGDNVYAYYIDKFGQKIQLGTDPNFDIIVVERPELNKSQILELENNLYKKEGIDASQQHIRAEVPADQKRALNGNIHIYSPIYASTNADDVDELRWNSHFNTVRYLEFEVMNEQGLTATFRVEQSPVTVIRNLEGFFSYRTDFRIDDAPVQFNADAFTSSLGKIKPVDNGPIHYLNPVSPFFCLAGFLPYHAHEVNEDGVLLLDNCNSSYKGYEELLYGFMDRPYHRSFDFGGPIAGVFHRDHYDNVDGKPVPSDATMANGANKYYQAFGLIYDDEATGKRFRRHYTGNFFETFWSKLVTEVYDEDVTITVPVLGYPKICETCTRNLSINPSSPETAKPYILASECKYPSHSNKYTSSRRFKIGETTKVIPRGQAAIYKISPTSGFDGWEEDTSTNSYWTILVWNSNKNGYNFSSTGDPNPSFYNHRMYHVRVTATSNEYTVGAPRLMDEDGKPTNDRERGYTLESEDNARLVSPSFMVASQLGESILPTQEHNYVMPGIEGFYYYAKRQCQEYVETRYEDENGNGKYDAGEPVYHYNDWRLPTKAEIDYIIKHQDTSRAMDKVMYAQYYYIASTKPGVYTEETLLSNQIPNYDTKYTGWYMRCVRDAFKEPEPVRYNR